MLDTIFLRLCAVYKEIVTIFNRNDFHFMVVFVAAAVLFVVVVVNVVVVVVVGAFASPST